MMSDQDIVRLLFFAREQAPAACKRVADETIVQRTLQQKLIPT